MAPITRLSKRHATEGPLGTPEPGHLATALRRDNYAESSASRPDAPESSEAEADPKPSRKRARRAQNIKGGLAPARKSKQARVKGRLEVFNNVPVEVFIEIAKYLHPFDLLLLSRVNKFFRELFMSRQAASIWVSARQSVPDLPPCPPELCEPQYAALLFTKMCSQCGKYAPRHMDPALLVRLCTKCREEEYKLGLTLSTELPDSTLVVASSLESARNLRRYGCLRLSSEIEAVYSKLQELTAAGDQDAILRWKSECRASVQNRYRNSQLYANWFKARDSEREDELIQRRDAHEAEVEARLISLGWEREDYLPYSNPRRRQWLSLVRTAKVLTDRAWDKLLPQLLEHLQVNKRERLERERTARHNDRYRALHDFWSMTKNQLPSLLQATPQQSDMEEAVSLSATVLRNNVLHQAFPPFSRAHEWPEYTRFKDEDITGADLKLKLEGKQGSLNEFAGKWRAQLEDVDQVIAS
ncbi:hypothetical protein B0J17DRAFT_412960 [Rhizoctonia solani]|nr:hypothetical protein B0J17DRAFT_412960 [Rhizoctonia solani]